MAKRRIRSTDKQPRVYVPGDFTSERGSRLGAVRTSGSTGQTTVVRVTNTDSSGDAGVSGASPDGPFALWQADSSLPGARVLTASSEIALSTATAGQLIPALIDGSVAYARIQDVTGVRLLGNSDTASAAVEEIEIGANLELKDRILTNTLENQPSIVRVLDADASLTATASAQAWFPTNGSATLPDAKSYLFRGVLFFDTTGVAISVLFAGTATISSITYKLTGIRVASGAVATTDRTGWQTGTTLPTTAVAATNATAGNGIIWVEGIVRVATTGTLTPQVSNVSAGGTAYKNSWFAFWELGADSITTKGTWS